MPRLLAALTKRAATTITPEPPEQPAPFQLPATHMLAGTDPEYRRDWQDLARNDRRIT